MTRKVLTRERRVFKELAATGKYVNTGKVLIGVAHQPDLPQLNREAERLQCALLGEYASHLSRYFMLYLALLTVVFASLVASCRS
jgi:hypothetical protein